MDEKLDARRTHYFMQVMSRGSVRGAAEANPDLVSADLNPLIVVDGVPVAVDALVEVER